MIGVSGVGQTSGLRYNLTGAAKFEFPVNFPGSFSFVGSYRVVPPNPVREAALTLPIRYDVTLNSIGEVTEAFASTDGS